MYTIIQSVVIQYSFSPCFNVRARIMKLSNPSYRWHLTIDILCKCVAIRILLLTKHIIMSVVCCIRKRRYIFTFEFFSFEVLGVVSTVSFHDKYFHYRAIELFLIPVSWYRCVCAMLCFTFCINRYCTGGKQ